MAKSLFHTYLPVLKVVTSIKDKKLKRRLLRTLCREARFKDCICEIANNTVKENFLLSPKDKKRLNKQAPIVRALLKKKRVTQSGGFLNIVVPLLASQLGELIFSKIKK